MVGARRFELPTSVPNAARCHLRYAPMIKRHDVLTIISTVIL